MTMDFCDFLWVVIVYSVDLCGKSPKIHERYFISYTVCLLLLFHVKEELPNLCHNPKVFGRLMFLPRIRMARELVPKICEIPGDALPFLLMGPLDKKTHAI